MTSESAAIVDKKGRGLTRIPSEILQEMNIATGCRLKWSVIGDSHAVLITVVYPKKSELKL